MTRSGEVRPGHSSAADVPLLGAAAGAPPTGALTCALAADLDPRDPLRERRQAVLLDV